MSAVAELFWDSHVGIFIFLACRLRHLCLFTPTVRDSRGKLSTANHIEISVRQKNKTKTRVNIALTVISLAET